MNSDQVNIFLLASKRLQWLTDRQRVLSENIANADTASYRARDVENFDDYLTRTAGAPQPPGAAPVERSTIWGEDLSGNSVVLEEQLMLASETSGQYRIASTLYRKAHDLLRNVAGAG